jgi:hypothetical protein
VSQRQANQSCDPDHVNLQRNAPWICATQKRARGQLGGTRGFEGLFDLVFGLGFLNRLPLHVARIIGASTFERKDVVDDVTRAGTGCGTGRRTGVTGLEGVSRCGAAADAAAGAPLASFAETWGRGRESAVCWWSGSGG